MFERLKFLVIKDMQYYILLKIEELFKFYIIVSNYVNFLKLKKIIVFFFLKRFYFNILFIYMEIFIFICECMQEKVNEYGMEFREFVNLLQVELFLRMGTDVSFMGGIWKKGRKGKVRFYYLLQNYCSFENQNEFIVKLLWVQVFYSRLNVFFFWF